MRRPRLPEPGMSVDYRRCSFAMKKTTRSIGKAGAYGLLFLLPAAFIAGSLVGGWSAREEFRKYRSLMSERGGDRAPAQAAVGLDGIASALNLPGKAKNPKPWRRSEVLAEDAAAGGATNATEAVVETAENEESPPRWRTPEDLGARIDEAKELWDMRREVARGQLIAKLSLDDEQAERLDAALQSMNDRLAQTFAAISANLDGDGVFTPELGARIIGDLGSTFAEAYDDIAACTDAENRAVVSELVLRDFIDPSVAEPLVKVQDKLRAGPVGLRPEDR